MEYAPLYLFCPFQLSGHRRFLTSGWPTIRSEAEQPALAHWGVCNQLEAEHAKVRFARGGTTMSRSLQAGVFRLGLLEDREVRVGFFPEGEEMLVDRG